MRKRAVLTFTILLGAFWAAGVSPAAGQVPPGPPPHVELPKDKKPKPEKPGKPDAPEEPSEPAPPPEPEPEPEPEPPSEEPAPPASEEPSTGGGGGTGGGGTGSGGATTGGGSGADARAADREAARAGSVLEATASGGEPGRSPEGGFSTQVPRSAASPAGGEENPDLLRGVAGASQAEARPERSTPAAVADEVVATVGVVPLALLAAGLALLTIGVTFGIAQARAARL